MANPEESLLKQTPLPTHDQLVSLIEFELDRAEKAASRPGWTTWALWGALATVAWFAGEEIKDRTIVWEMVELWFLVISMMTDLIVIFSGLLNQKSRKHTQKHRFILANRSFGSARPLLALLLIRYSILTFISIQHFAMFPVWSAYALVGYTFFISIFFAIGLGISFASYPLSTRQASTVSQNIFFSLLVIAAILATIGSLAALSQHASPNVFEDGKIAGLLWTETMLVILLSMARPRSPLIESLVDIRRDLGLNNIDTSNAKRQIELAIHGLQVTDVLQEELTATLTPLRLASNTQEQIIREIEALLIQLPSDLTVMLTTEQNNLISAVIRSIKSLQQDTDKGLARAKSAATLFSKKAAFVIASNPNSEPELAQLRSEIDSAIDNVKERTNKSAVSIEKLNLRIRGTKQEQHGNSTPTALS